MAQSQDNDDTSAKPISKIFTEIDKDAWRSAVRKDSQKGGHVQNEESRRNRAADKEVDAPRNR